MQLYRQFLSFLRAFRYPVYKLTGVPRFGGGCLRVLYAGSPLFRNYLQLVAFDESPTVEYLGKRNFYDLSRLAAQHQIDLEVVRSHILLARVGVFSRNLYVPEWLAGSSSLSEQRRYEATSKSRQRDRKLLERNGIDYVVTTSEADLNYFYDEMYVPHVTASHSDAAFLMSRENMLKRMSDGEAELLSIRMAGKAVGGSFIVYDDGQPRLNSSGVLNKDKELLRDGVGIAIYLKSFDYLAERGFDKVHMGFSRAFLNDGALYFKQRLGLHVTEPTTIGYRFRPISNSTALENFLANTGYIHVRNGSIRAAIYTGTSGSASQQYEIRQRELAENIGIRDIDLIERGDRASAYDYRISNVKVAHNDS